MPRDRRTIVFAAVAAGATLAVAVPTFAATRADRPSLAVAAGATGAADDRPGATVSIPSTADTVPAPTAPTTVSVAAGVLPTVVTVPDATVVTVPAAASSGTSTPVSVTDPPASASSTPTSRDDDDWDDDDWDDDDRDDDDRDDCDDDDRREGDDDCRPVGGSQGSVPDTSLPAAPTTETRTVEVPGVVTVEVRRDGTRLTVLGITAAPGWRIVEQQIRADELDLELRGPDRREADVDIDTDDGWIEVSTDLGVDD